VIEMLLAITPSGTTALNGLAAAVRVRRASCCAAFGYLLLAGCSLETSPDPGAPSKTMIDAAWMPPTAAEGSRTSASRVGPDGAVDATATAAMAMHMVMDMEVDPTQSDAGEDAKPLARRDAGATPEPDKDAGLKVAKDAARPMQPTMPTTPAIPTTPKPSHCKPGVYAGTFSGSIQLVGLSLSSVTGTVRAELNLDAAAQHLEFHGAKVVGVDQDGNRLTVELSGTVNCTDNRLEGGKLTNGNFHNKSADNDTAFTGAADAMYSQEPYALVGTFSVEAQETSLLGGRGTWSLLLSE
jgi:hypothetical protein